MESPETQIVAELAQIHEYARQEVSVYVAWFTFFITTLMAAMGWTLRAALNEAGVVVKPAPFYCAVFLFSVQLAFSIVATSAVEADLVHADQRGLDLERLLPVPQAPTFTPASPFPQGIHRAIDLMYWTLWSNLLFWLAMAWYVRCHRKRKLFGN